MSLLVSLRMDEEKFIKLYRYYKRISPTIRKSTMVAGIVYSVYESLVRDGKITTEAIPLEEVARELADICGHTTGHRRLSSVAQKRAKLAAQDDPLPFSDLADKIMDEMQNRFSEKNNDTKASPDLGSNRLVEDNNLP